MAQADRVSREITAREAATPPDLDLRAAAAAGGLSLVVLWWWVLRAPFVGLADNGDWGRYSCPVGYDGKVRFTELPDTLTQSPCPAFDYRSTFTAFLELFARIDNAMSGAVHLSHLALFWCVVVSAGWAWLTLELARATGRPWRALAVTAAMIVVSSDVIFTSYFGSVYAEAMVIALIPALAAALVRLVRSDHLDRATIALAVGLLVAITGAKPSMALVAQLFVGVVVLARRSQFRLIPAATAMVGAVALSVFSFAAIADPTFTEWNTYNLAFTVVLPESDDPRAALIDMGVEARSARELERFVGVPFGPEVTEAWDEPPLTAFREAGRPAVLRALATQPSTWVAMVRRGASTLGDLRLDYLANHVGSPLPNNQPRLADRPHPADAALGPLAATWWLLPIAWVSLTVWLARRLWLAARRRPSPAARAALALFAVLSASTQTVLALGDGYYELAKHLVVAGHLTAVTLAGLLVAAVTSLLPRGEQPEAKES